MGALGPEQRKEPRYQVTYNMYLASGRRLSYTPSVECVVGLKYAKRSLLVLQNFAIFRLRHAHVRKDTRLLYYAKLNFLPIFLAMRYLTCWEATCAVAGRLFSLRSISLSASLNSPKSSRWSPLVSICSNNLRKWREEKRVGVRGGIALQLKEIVQLLVSIRL